MGGIRILYLIFLWNDTLFSDNHENVTLFAKQVDQEWIWHKILDNIDNKDNKK